MEQVKTLETISANHLEIISNAVQVFRRKGEQVTESRIVDFIRLHFPEYRAASEDFLRGVATFILI